MLGDTPFHLVFHSLSSWPFVAVHRCPFNLSQRFVDRLETTEGYPCERVGRSTRLNGWRISDFTRERTPSTVPRQRRHLRRGWDQSCFFFDSVSYSFQFLSRLRFLFASSFTGIFYDELLTNTSTPLIISCFLSIAEVTRRWIVQILGNLSSCC